MPAKSMPRSDAFSLFSVTEGDYIALQLPRKRGKAAKTAAAVFPARERFVKE
jgi:hypothetical protein